MAVREEDKVDKEGDAEYQRRRSYLPWLFVAAGLIMSVAAHFLVRDWEEAIIRADFELLSATDAFAVQRELVRHSDALVALAGLYDASLEVDRSEFRQFVAGVFKQHDDIEALMWVPRLAAAQRDSLGQQAVRQGLPDFHIREFDSSSLKERAEYFPVYYLEPSAPNAGLLGVDVMREPAYRAVLEVARDGGEVVGSAPIPLPSEQGLEYGILLARAIYQKDMVLDSVVQRRTALQGFVLQLFCIDDFVRESLQGSADLGLEIGVYYENIPGDPQRIYFQKSTSREEAASPFTGGADPGQGLVWRTSLGIADRPWELVMTPGPKFWASHPIWRSWVVSGTGFLISIWLGLYLLTMSRQSGRTESLARSLALTNQNLEKEIVERSQLEAQSVKLSRAIEQAADAVMITDRQGYIEYVNPAFETMTGYTRAEAIGKKPSLVKSGQHDAGFYSQLWGTISRGEVFQDVLVNRRKNGVLYYEEKTITPLKDRANNITHYIATSKDITDRMQTQERLHYLAYNDLLTNLPNRLLFLERVDHALKGRRGPDHRLAILYLDLDRFKIINDTLGHQVGDDLLQKIAGLLPSTVGVGDTVARLGGDEFGVLLEDVVTLDGVTAVARRILAAFAQPFQIGGRELYIAPSIGISVYPEDGHDAHVLLKNAEVAMYRAKDQGGNNYQYYSADMSSKAFERLNLETSLRRALEREEFRVCFQPQIDLASGRVMGAEALIRWQHPDLGLVHPLEFIPLLEETGLIVPVGEWVVKQACEWAVAWQQHQPLRVSVNLSGRQFRDPRLSDQVLKILESTGLKPEMLEMEITESVLMQSDKTSADNLLALDRIGVRLAIDDFGTGYSSLSYLKRFPIKTLKIDRAFIRDLNTDPDDAAIVTAIIAMARSLEMEVVAEGVETTQQLNFLRELGCGAIQGFLISKALPVVEINRFLARGHQVLSIAPSQIRR